MDVSVYESSVPVFLRMLDQLARILDKGAAHAQEQGLDPSALLQARLAADMYPLVKQVQVAADAAVDGAARLAQAQAPRFDDTERSFPELQERIRQSAAFLRSLDPSRFEGAQLRTVSWTARGEAITVPGLAYLLNHAMPKFYFHLATAYAILRHEGVALSKGDFMGKT